ncbi:MAG: hypothetical protein AB1650_04455, partial [Candidatus Omnitrophota bacterium]
KTDPDFSALQRYKNAFNNIKSFIWREDELLLPGGFEKALALTTSWTNSSLKVFYTVDNKLFTVRLDGSEREEIFTAADVIKQGVFSPDGRWIAVKTGSTLDVVKPSKKIQERVFDIAQPLPDKGSIDIGGIQWSPDSKKICYFVTKRSRVSSQTGWFVFNLSTGEHDKLPLTLQQNIFLSWGSDSERLYFHYVKSDEREGKKVFKTSWYEIQLATLTPVLVKEIVHGEIDVSDEILKKHNIRVYASDKRLRFESPQPFIRDVFINHEDGRRLFVNKKLQLCYQSKYGVRFRLFGLSTMGQYMMFFSPGKASDLTIEDVRWTPSGNYVLMKHVVHGLILLQPVSRRAGVLAEQAGIYGIYTR